MTANTSIDRTDVLLIGAGIVSAHVGAFLKLLQPDWTITLVEREDIPASESSDPWNNAGTGHSALCELNYTPGDAKNVDISKAIGVNEKFQLSRQWWSWALENNIISNPKDFINPTPHVSFVHGQDNIDYLKTRYETLKDNPLFSRIQFSTDEQTFSDKFPLMANGRDYSEPVAISWVDNGTDLNYGALAKKLYEYLGSHANIFYGHEAFNLNQEPNGSWNVKIKNLRTGKKRNINAQFVFVGAGGYALPVLQKSGIKEAKGIGGFPISGIFARCKNPDIIAQHAAKVYGKASVGAPPMSVPHLDTRIIDGKKGLLFGPYAGFSPKFLKHGRYTDLLCSIKPDNLIPMLSIGLSEFSLEKYLITELTKSFDERIKVLQEFIPQAHGDDWEMISAGQRVQIIRKKKDGLGGNLEFGTAVVAAADGTIAGLLGASPGASIVVSAALEVLEKCFPKHYQSWKPTLHDMIPSYGTKLADNPELFAKITDWSNKVLQLTDNTQAAS